MARLSRRNLLGAGGCTVAAGIASVSLGGPDAQAVELAPVAVYPDADLIAACAAFDVLEQRYRATFDGVEAEVEWDARDAERDRIIELQDPHFDRIMALPATTMDGLRAKARTAALEYPELLEEDAGSRSGNLMISIIEDLVGNAEHLIKEIG